MITKNYFIVKFVASSIPKIIVFLSTLKLFLAFYHSIKAELGLFARLS